MSGSLTSNDGLKCRRVDAQLACHMNRDPKENMSTVVLVTLALGALIFLALASLASQRNVKETNTTTSQTSSYSRTGSYRSDNLTFTFGSQWTAQRVLALRSGLLIPVREATPGFKLFVVNMTVRNDGNQRSFFDPFAYPVQLKDQHNRLYDGMYYTANWFSLLGFINPGSTVNGQIVFDIPNDASALEMVLHHHSVSDNQVLYRLKLAG